MKTRLLSLLCVLLMSLGILAQTEYIPKRGDERSGVKGTSRSASGSSTKVSYTLSLGESFASGTTIDCDIITLTFGEAGGPDFQPAIEYPIDDTFIFYTQGNGIDGNKEKGTFYLFTPTKNGLLTIGIRQNKNKKLYIVEDGIVMPDFNGIICSEEEALSYALSFQVKAGSTYKVYGSGTKLGFYGFVFDTDYITVKADDVTMTYGDEIPKLSYSQINGNVTGIPQITTTATKYSPVGTYPIIVEKGSVQEEKVFYLSGMLTIIPAPLSVGVNDETITRGEAIPSFTLTYDGWRNNDTEETAFIKKPTIKTSVDQLSPTGVYEIYAEGGEAPNYSLTYQPGKLTILAATEDHWADVTVKRQITHPQPMTGLVLRPYKAEELHNTYGQSIQLEYDYYLPCDIVKGCKEDGTIIYDWSSFDAALNDVANRGHQLVPRFRYVWPGSGPTTVPEYIKQLQDYHETFSDVDSEGPTYYADWSNAELQRFTLQFYTDFFKRYAHDPRLAFLQVGFGHWAEYHIYPTHVEYGQNFPSLEYQKKFLLHLSEVSDGLPWLISKNAGDNSPVPDDDELLALRFGLFEDSFMGEFFLNGGYKVAWNGLGGQNRWKIGAIGGEVGPSYEECFNFLNPEGLYGHFYEEVASKYHVTFMGGNCAPDNLNGTPERMKQASMAMGYRFVVKKCATDGTKTLLLVRNEGIAPIYRDAYFAIGDVRSNTSLKGLLPNEETWVEIAAKPRPDGKDITIVSDFILPQQEIEFEADLTGNIKSSTVTAKSYSRIYGEDNPKFEYSVEGETLDGTPEISCEATATSPVGTYDIVISQGNVSNFYVIYVNGTLTIKKAPLTVGVENVTITEGDPIPSFTLTYSGFRNSDTESKAFTTKPTAKTRATASSKPGTYSITISGGEASNYELTYQPGKLTIEPAVGIESVCVDGQGNGVIYNVNGQKLSKPRKGINIIDGKKVVVK